MGALAAILSMALAASPTGSVSSIAAPISNWRNNIRIDPIKDREEGSVSLVSTDGRSRLLVACNGLDDRAVSIQYITPSYLGSQGSNVIVRVDGNPPASSYSWIYKGAGAYTVNEELITAILAQIGDGTNRIVLRAYDFEDQPHDAVFSSINGRSEIAKIQKICARPAQP